MSSPDGRADLTRPAMRPPRVPGDAAVVRAGWSVCEAAVSSVVLDSLIQLSDLRETPKIPRWCGCKKRLPTAR